MDASPAGSFVISSTISSHPPLTAKKMHTDANPKQSCARRGAMAEDVGRSETYKTSRVAKVATRKEAITAAVDEGLDGVGALRAMLAQRWMRVVDLLRDWDEDGNGTVSLREFAKALPVIGLKVSAETVQALFTEFDADGSGEIEPAEIVHTLTKMGLRLSKEELDAVVYELDVDGDGMVELHEYM